MPTYYEILGIAKDATQSDIKAAYRSLVRTLHPDVNPDPGAKQSFLEVQKAYEALSDIKRKEAYDAILRNQDSGPIKEARSGFSKEEKERKETEELRKKAEAMMRDFARENQAKPIDTEKLRDLVNAGKILEAESLANQILESDPRQPLPYAVLGDIAKMRGETRRALQFYGYAAQYEPKNAIYQKKYEEILSGQNANQPKTTTSFVTQVKATPLICAVFAVLLMAIYVAIAPEKGIGISFAPNLTTGAIVMSIISGCVIGGCLVLSGLTARFEDVSTTAVIRISPLTTIGVLSILSFWLACAFYFVIGQTQQAFNRSISAFLGTISATSILFAILGLSKGPEFATQIMLWCTNLSCFSGLAGWMALSRFKTE